MGAERTRILLVDPDQRSARLLELSLEKEGFAVEVVGGTIDALLALHQGECSAVISEIDLADGDGLELLSQVRLDPDTGTLPFVFVTSRKDEATGAAANEAGANAVLGKPVRVKQVVEEIRSLTGVAASADAGPDLGAVYTVEYRSFVAQLGKLPDETNAVIRLFDGKRTVADVIEAAGIDEAKATEVLTPLLAADVLRPLTGDALDAALRGRPDPAAARARRAPEGRESVAAQAADTERMRLETAARAAEEEARAAAEAARLAAEDAARRAEEARRRAEEERIRQQEQDRVRQAAEIASIDAELTDLQEQRTQELAAARAQAEQVREEAERLAAELRADAEEKAAELRRRERELSGRKQSLTQRMEAIVGPAGPPVPEPEPAPEESGRMTATLTLSPDPASRGGQPREEVTDPWSGSAPESAAAPEPAAAPATPPAVPAEARAEPPTIPPALPGAAGSADVRPMRPVELSSPSVSGTLDDSFFGRVPAEHDHDDELFAEPQRDGVPPVVWAIGLLLLTALFIVLLSSGRGDEPEPEAPAAPAAVAEAPAAEAEGSAEVEPVEPPGPTPEEIAEAEAETARSDAVQGAIDDATETQYLASDIAEAIAFAPPVEPVAAAPAAASATSGTRPRRQEPRREAASDTNVDRAVRTCATAYGDGNYGETITACEAAVRAAPTNSDAYTYLGKATYELGNVDQAIGYLERAVRMNRRNRNALLALGAAKQDAGDLDGAREAYEQYLEYNPDSRHAAEVRSILESM